MHEPDCWYNDRHEGEPSSRLAFWLASQHDLHGGGLRFRAALTHVCDNTFMRQQRSAAPCMVWATLANFGP